MSNLKVSDAQLKGILDDLEKDLGMYLNEAEGKLAKAREEGGSPTPSPSASGSPSASMGSPSASMSGGSPSASVAPAQGTPTPGTESPMGEGDAAPAGPAAAPGQEMAPEAGMEGGDMGQEGGPVDPAALEAEYAQLPVEELKAHYLAAKAALMAAMGGGQGQQGQPPPQAGPPAAAPSPAPSPAGAGAPPMAMSEDYKGLKLQMETLAKAVNLIAGQPIQKAVTGLSYVAKSESAEEKKVFSRTEITAKLDKLTRDPKLAKSDRDQINGYYEGQVSVDKIAHLLK